MSYERKIINDPVFGFIHIPKGLLYNLVCHPLMQRLTRIKQVGLSSVVYPGAQHTRFQHSLGAFYLMSEAVQHLKAKGNFIFDSEAEAVQAAILLPKLHALRRDELAALNRAADAYTRALTGLVQTPAVAPGMTSSWAQYSVLFDNAHRRDQAQARLKAAGIPSMIYYPRGIHQQTAYADRHFPDEWYPNTLSACQRVLALPMHPYLTDADIARVVENLR